MFIASKYEDVIPLLMRTVINKIGHNKFEIPLIEDKELEILNAIQYKIGSPTVKEFLDRFFEEIGEPSLKAEKFQKICMYLAKMACHNYSLMQMQTSLLASAVLNVALKIYEKIEPKIDVAAIMSRILSFAQLDILEAKSAAKEMLTFAKNFDKLYPNFKNLR
jgi:predicted unusual protein kinase regulating ubiquinone biosynthesis (AarF/ABC1/UbiB family)